MPMPWEAVGEAVGDAAGAVAGGVARGVEAVGDVLDIGEPSGNDHGSSNWSAWGHAEIRSMLDTTVHPEPIHEIARLWQGMGQAAHDLMTGLTRDLRATVSAGWHGESADAAVRSLEPAQAWAATVREAAERTTQLMDASGSSVGQAKRAVPPPVHHDWGQSLNSFVRGGALGVGVDAFAQDEAQEAARAEAVRIMTNVYSAPINEHQAAVPAYPPLADPTLGPAEPGNPSPRDPSPGGPSPSVPDTGGRSAGGPPGYQFPAAAGLQGGAGYAADSGQFGPGQLGGGPRQVVGGPSPGGPGFGAQGFGPGAAAAAVPFVSPTAAGGLGSDERARRGFRGAAPGGGRVGGAGGRASSGTRDGSFGPRGSGAAAAGEGRAGGGAAGGRGGAGAGGVPVAGTGAGRGRGEDIEHQRPSYLIEMDDIFGDGRKVAPPVIGEDPPESYR